MKPVTAAQMRVLDQKTTSEYGIPGLLLMENAGRGAAEIIQAAWAEDARILVVCGKGNNGGDGFVAARHLFNFGRNVTVYLASSPNLLKDDALLNFQILSRLGVSIVIDSPSLKHSQLIENNDVIVDALLGIGVVQPVREPLKTLISDINQSRKKVYALDVPSGLDPDTGVPMGISISAYATITFGAPKVGFYQNAGPSTTGEVFVIDIGIPRPLFSEILGPDFIR